KKSKPYCTGAVPVQWKLPYWSPQPSWLKSVLCHTPLTVSITANVIPSINPQLPILKRYMSLLLRFQPIVSNGTDCGPPPAASVQPVNTCTLFTLAGKLNCLCGRLSNLRYKKSAFSH